MLLRLRHAVGDGGADGIQAAVAPLPLAGSQIGADRRADAAGAVAAGACCSGLLAVEDLLPEIDLRLCRAGRRRELRSYVGVDAFRGEGSGRGLGMRRRSGSGLEALDVGIAHVSDAPDAARL